MFPSSFYLRFAVFSTLSILCLTKCQNESPDQQILTQGASLFSKHCSSCHGLAEDGFGPPLGGITSLISENDLVRFIRDPLGALEAGDDRTHWLQQRYKQVMPSFAWLPETEVHSIIAFIRQQSALYQLTALSIDQDSMGPGLTGRLVAPVEKSTLKIEVEEVIQIPQLPGSSPDLGIVTLRAHPAADGTLYVSDQDGIIYRMAGSKASIFLDVRTWVPDFQSGPGIATGIASFDFHPDYLHNGLFYLLHAETYRGQVADYTISDSIKAEVQWVLSEWKMQDVESLTFSGSYREILRLHAPTFGHGAQDLRFNRSRNKTDPGYALLYFGYGDGGANNIGMPGFGHHLKSFLGTIMCIDPAGRNSKNGKYGIPADNPFVHDTDPATVKEIYAFGFRNPHRITWDPNHHDRMIATDIGEANIEEINIIEKGGDYGWPRREGNYGIVTTHDKKSVHEVPLSDQGFYKSPFAQYDHEDGFAISGGFVYQGDLLPLKNKYVFGDIVNGKLFYLNMDPALSDSTIYEVTIMQDGRETNLQELSQQKRIHLRIGYDEYARQLYVITKCDGRIRRVSDAIM